VNVWGWKSHLCRQLVPPLIQRFGNNINQQSFLHTYICACNDNGFMKQRSIYFQIKKSKYNFSNWFSGWKLYQQFLLHTYICACNDNRFMDSLLLQLNLTKTSKAIQRQLHQLIFQWKLYQQSLLHTYTCADCFSLLSSLHLIFSGDVRSCWRSDYIEVNNNKPLKSQHWWQR